jgi:hypothetical protein
MSRLVTPLERSTRDVHRAYQRPDEYLDRVAKYVPAEIVGAYVSLDGTLAARPPLPMSAILPFADTAWAQPTTPQMPAAPDAAPKFVDALISAMTSLPGLVFLLCLVLAPLYVWVLARRAGTTVWKAQAAIAALAFVVWAYAIKGTVFFSDPTLNKWAAMTLQQPTFYNPQWGAALLVLFSLAAAFYQPKAD